MSSTPPKSAKSTTKTPKQQATRDRSAAALRENLKRRKTQARQQAGTTDAQGKVQGEDVQ